MIQKILKTINRVFPAQTAYAHCDVPCGIYDPISAELSAKTVLKMVEKIKDLKKADNPEDDLANRNSLIRMVHTKEEHSQLCKKELLILWTDYFKPEHLEKFPDLHTKFWEAAKLCSQNKQEIDQKAAEQLLDAVKGISKMFHDAEKAKKA